MVKPSPRQWTPYEQTQLARYGRRPEVIVTADIPVEYVTGIAEFAGRPFLVTPATLIPRIETEQLVELVVNDISSSYPTAERLSIIEVGTGCGAIGVTLSWELRRRGWAHRLVVSDVSTKALAVARLNFGRLAATAPVTFVVSDLLGTIKADLQADVIVANLPYIPTARLASLSSSVTGYEPAQALDGGSDGARLIRRLVAQAPSHLKPKGRVWLEIDHTHRPADLRTNRGDYQLDIFEDSANLPRFARLQPTRPRC
ncbi:MAG: hypothetical protein COU69_02295 [Candidatus Pacebacteria bacterium CG10_big_fil_rev_8_21_14_0_10_56_10]|nr:MAG: hypothetical protein COU69_02295 [Candidatus Pacebacteria bacterium CG10_big_fil_rev_8_21_14_0_10_56_10]